MKDLVDLVTAVYYRDCYAGATILRLVDVLYCEDIPEKYNHYKYEVKIMALTEWSGN